MKTFLFAFIILSLSISACASRRHVDREIDSLNNQLDKIENSLNNIGSLLKPRTTSADLDGDGQIAKEELVEYLKIAFDKVSKKNDMHGDDKITKDELVVYGDTSFAEDILKKIDKNNDGVITEGEFINQYEITFSKLDRNGDGYYSMKDSYLSDRNGDGIIDVIEYREALVELVNQISNQKPMEEGNSDGCPFQSEYILCTHDCTDCIGIFIPIFGLRGFGHGSDERNEAYMQSCLDPTSETFDPWHSLCKCFPFCPNL